MARLQGNTAVAVLVLALAMAFVAEQAVAYGDSGSSGGSGGSGGSSGYGGSYQDCSSCTSGRSDCEDSSSSGRYRSGGSSSGSSCCYINSQCKSSPCSSGTCPCQSTNMCPSVGGVCGDPHFVGGNGVRYDFHGVPEKSFCLIADKAFHLNAHFIGQDGLETGEDGTWMSKLGLIFVDGMQSHTLKLELVSEEELANPNHVDTFLIEYDGSSVEVIAPKSGQASWTSADNLVSLRRTAESSDGIWVEIKGHFAGKLVASEHEFPEGHHIDFEVSQLEITKFAHGVLGQTFQPSRTQLLASSDDMNRDTLDVVDGSDNDYISTDLLATDCHFARYEAPSALTATRRFLLGGKEELVQKSLSCKDQDGVLSCLME